MLSAVDVLLSSMTGRVPENRVLVQTTLSATLAVRGGSMTYRMGWVLSVLLNHDWVFHTHGVLNRSRRLAQLGFFLSSKRDVLLPLDQGQGADRRGQFFVRFL